MILVMLVLAFFEGIGVLMFFNSDIALLLWLLEKLVLYPLVLWYCVQLNQLKSGTEKIAGGEPGYQISTKRMTGRTDQPYQRRHDTCDRRADEE